MRVHRYGSEQFYVEVAEEDGDCGAKAYRVHRVSVGGDAAALVFHGFPHGEFATSDGSRPAGLFTHEVGANRTLRLSFRAENEIWSADEVIVVDAENRVFRRCGTYHFHRPWRGAIHPGFRLRTATRHRTDGGWQEGVQTESGAAGGAIRYTYPVHTHDSVLSTVIDPIRAPVDHGLPLPFHIVQRGRLGVIYGVDKSASETEGMPAPGTIDFGPADADGYARLGVYYPDTTPSTLAPGSLGRRNDLARPRTAAFAAGTELVLKEVLHGFEIGEQDDPLLEGVRQASSILIPAAFDADAAAANATDGINGAYGGDHLVHRADVTARPVVEPAPAAGSGAAAVAVRAADGIARFYAESGLWNPDALGPGRGWFRNMVVRTCTGSGDELRFDGTGPLATDGGTGYDFGWGEGFGVYAMTAIIRHWRRSGDTTLLPYLDEMTRNMELFRRPTADPRTPAPYFDTCRDGVFRANCGGRLIWTYALGRVGYELAGLYLDGSDYPKQESRARWWSVAVEIASFLAEHQDADGDIQDTFDGGDLATGPAFLCEEPRLRCSARAIVCGLWTRLAAMTGDPLWLDHAKRLARVVIPEVLRYEFSNAHMDHGCPDAEAPAHVLAGLLPLYTATGDPKVLRACKAAAAYNLSWTYLYDVATPKTHNGAARGGQCCCRCEPIIFVVGSATAVEPLLELSAVTGDPLFGAVAQEMVSYIVRSTIAAPGKAWDGGVIHAFLMYCGRSHGPGAEGQVDTGMATGSSLAALEAWLAAGDSGLPYTTSRAPFSRTSSPGAREMTRERGP